MSVDNPAVGAWIRFNPLDGKGVKNENITEYRYALVESDSMDIASQNAVIRELELPVACLVYSGGKSLHAIVRVDAGSYEEYRARVDYLYKVCAKNGLDIDKQNRNPSRLSRMPGVVRGEHKQFLVDTNIGKSSFEEWRDWIESVNDDLPDEDTAISYYDDEDEAPATPAKKKSVSPSKPKPAAKAPAKTAPKAEPEEKFSIPVEVKKSDISVWDIPEY